MLGQQITVSTIVSLMISGFGLYLSTTINNDLVIVPEFKGKDFVLNVRNNGPVVASGVRVTVRTGDGTCAKQSFTRRIAFLSLNESRIVWYRYDNEKPVFTTEHYCIERDGIFALEKFVTGGTIEYGIWVTSGEPSADAKHTSVTRSFTGGGCAALPPLCDGAKPEEFD